MKVQVANDEFFVKFQHNNFEQERAELLKEYGKDYVRKKVRESSTVCWIEKNHKIISTAESKLHKGDKYCKDKGRKIALKLALGSDEFPIGNQTGFTKHERALFWEEYLKMTNNVIRKSN